MKHTMLYTNISREEACRMYYRWRRVFFSVSSGYWVCIETGTEELPEDATKWPPTVELSPSEMAHYLAEITA